MKKLTIIVPIVTIIVISVLGILYIDFNESNAYLKFKNYDIETINIHYDNNIENAVDIVKNLQYIAKQHNIILTKSNIDNKKKNGVNVYISLNSIDDLSQFLNKNFKIKTFKNKRSETGFFSTYNQNSEHQMGIIKDLLEDHYYTYYLMDQLIEKDGSLFGNYSVLYTDFNDYSNFISEANKLVGYNTYSISLSTNIDKYISIAIIGSFFVLLLFYFVFQVYEYYNNSKKIGCMKLLGFDINKINKNMISKNVKIYLISILILFLLIIFLVKNITPLHILGLLVINLLILLLTYYFSNWACRIVNKTYKISDILKNQSITFRISQVSYIFRVIMIVLIICFSILAIDSISVLLDKLKLYNSSKNLLEYGVLDSFAINQQEINDYDKQYDLYLRIVNSNELETVYSKFYVYDQLTSEDWLNIKNDEKNGNFYLYDSIDKNYLKKEKIQVYNMDNKKMDIDKINGIYFLFPKSKKELIKNFEKYHDKELKDYYRKFNNNYIFQAYLYDDRNVDTYRLELKKFIENPILRVIDESITESYINDSEGVSVFGSGVNTGLKIKLINGDKEKTKNILQKYIAESGLSSLLTKSSFITYKDYFNDEILSSQVILLFAMISTVIIFIVYTLISLQLLKLYIRSQKKKILVKKLLGFNNNDIFQELFTKNLNNILLSTILSLFILIIIKKLTIYFLFIILTILLLDFVITLVSIKTIKLSTIYLDLKGETYD